MTEVIRRACRMPRATLAVFLATFLGSLPMGLAAEPTPDTALPADPGAVQERAVPRTGEFLDLSRTPKAGGSAPGSSGGSALVAAGPLGPPDPVAPIRELPIHLAITNTRDPAGNNIGVRGQVDRVVGLVNANMAQQQNVRAKLKVESFSVFGPNMSATTYTDRPNHRFVHIPYMVMFKIYDVQVKAGGRWTSTSVTRTLSQSIGVHIFCDRWETGKGSLKLVTAIDRPYMEPNQGLAEQVVDFFLNGYLTDSIDSIVRKQLASIPLTNATVGLGLDCNALGRDKGAPDNPKDDVIQYSYRQSGLPGFKGDTILGQLSLTLQSIKRLAARDLQGRPLYAVSETPRLEVYANQFLTAAQLPAMQEGQQVSIAAPSISMPATGLPSVSVLINLRQANGIQVDSATYVYGKDVNYGNGAKTVRIRKSYWTQANPTTGAKPQQVFVDAYELAYVIQGPGGLVVGPTGGTGSTTGLLEGTGNFAVQGAVMPRGVEGEQSAVESPPEGSPQAGEVQERGVLRGTAAPLTLQSSAMKALSGGRLPYSCPEGSTLCGCRGTADCKDLENAGKCSGSIECTFNSPTGQPECTCKKKATLVR